jgi:hypothetical protein
MASTLCPAFSRNYVAVLEHVHDPPLNLPTVALVARGQLLNGPGGLLGVERLGPVDICNRI